MKEYYPVLGNYGTNNYCHININALSVPDNASMQEMNGLLEEFVEKFRIDNIGIPYGGFLEERSLYKSSIHFSVDKIRNIHLGIDLWIPADTPVYAALDGEVHSVAYNSALLDYGWCVIIDYGENEFVLYGHMSSQVLEDFNTGDIVKKGQIIGYIGDYHENGGWYPHLHLQVMNTMLNFKGDFPGVASKQDIDYYKTIIKDPAYLL